MARVIEPAELRPAAGSPDFVERFGRVLRAVGLDAPAVLTGVHVADGDVAERLWNLGRLVFGEGLVPDADWAVHPPLLDVWTHGLEQNAVREALAAVGPTDATEVLVAIDDAECPDVISAPWRFCREHVLPGLFVTIVMPPDAAWVLVNHHGEFIRACRTRFTAVRSIVFRPKFARHDGLRVPKPRYEVRFADGSRWNSGDLRRDVARERRLDSSLATVAALAGMTVANGPV